jgi:hypothetical protein
MKYHVYEITIIFLISYIHYPILYVCNTENKDILNAMNNIKEKETNL